MQNILNLLRGVTFLYFCLTSMSEAHFDALFDAKVLFIIIIRKIINIFFISFIAVIAVIAVTCMFLLLFMTTIFVRDIYVTVARKFEF